MITSGYGLGKMFFPGFGLLLQIIILILVILIIIWVLKSGKVNNETPEEILKKRLAKGEITKKEYNELLKEISNDETTNINKSQKKI